jgi:tripartite ATP-independent transporter DctM subunit
MLTGMPIALSFLLTCMIGGYLWWGGLSGLAQLATGLYSPVASFTLLPVPMFILMGALIFESGMGTRVVDVLDRLLGKRVPVRLSVLAVGAGAILGALIGISGASASILGKTLLPEMLRRGYRGETSLGPIVASGTLATMIPPSALGILVGAMSGVSISGVLLGIILPGLLLAGLYLAYLLVRYRKAPVSAPDERSDVSFSEKVVVFVRDLLPLALIMFAVVGTIFIGVATPSEAAALGVVACLLLAAAYRRLNWKVLWNSLVSTVHITSMVFFIVVGAVCFSRILASSGALRGLVDLATSLSLPPMLIVAATLAVVFILGCFMDAASITMVTVPLFTPLVSALGVDLLWYAVVYLLVVQLGLITPPFGLDVYTVKAVAPPEVTLTEAFRAAMSFLVVGLVVAALLFAFPRLALLLPAMAKA